MIGDGLVGLLQLRGFDLTFPGGLESLSVETADSGCCVMFGYLESGWRPSLIPNQGVWVSKIDLKLRWMIGQGSGRAHSKAGILGSRLHVPRRLTNKCGRFAVESKWPRYHFSKGRPE